MLVLALAVVINITPWNTFQGKRNDIGIWEHNAYRHLNGSGVEELKKKHLTQMSKFFIRKDIVGFYTKKHGEKGQFLSF